MKHISLWVALLIAGFICVSCSDDESPDPRADRYVYYCIPSSSSATESGLYRYDLNDGSRVRMAEGNVAYCTNVASNGIVLFDSETETERFSGICEGGSIISVPFPVSEDPDYSYEYGFPPYLTLSAQGHHALYPVKWGPSGTQNEGEKASQLVLFNCYLWKMTIIDVNSIVAAEMGSIGATKGVLTGDYAFVSPDGNTVWFAAAGVISATQSGIVGYGIFQWTPEGTQMIAGVSSGVFELYGYNDRAQTLVYAHDGTMRAQRLIDGGITGYEISAVEPWQVGMDYDVLVQWEDDGVVIRKASDGSFSWRIMERETLEQQFGRSYTFEANDHIAVSPDCYWVVFTLTLQGAPGTCDLFAMRDNGKELVRLAEGIPAGFPAISPKLTN